MEILFGNTPSIKSGTVLGQKGMSKNEEVDTAVKDFKKGDWVIISCIAADDL